MVAVVPQEDMVALVSRTGRHLQRYSKGRRQVVGVAGRHLYMASQLDPRTYEVETWEKEKIQLRVSHIKLRCIPYRYKYSKQSPAKDDEAKELEVLVITSQKGKGKLFPKGGWELDESKEGAASRETLEEAGVRGIIESELGKWSFKSKSHDAYYDGYMFPLHVEEQLDFWPEKNLRQRIWMSVQEARDVCQHWWMKDALDRLVSRLASQQQQEEEHEGQELGSVRKSMRANLFYV